MALEEKVLTKVCETFYFDAAPSMSSRFAGIYQQLGNA
jgi:hypothetical protein